MLEEIVISSVAIIGLIIATITDIKYREVPDYLSYFLITTGFVFRFFYSVLNNNWYYFLYGLIGFGICFLIGLLLYLTKQWGGGDTKLLMGLGVIFATKPFFIKQDGTYFLNTFINQDLIFLFNLLIFIFLTGAAYGLIYGVYLAFKNKNNFVKEFKRILNEDNIKFVRVFSLIISGILVFLIFLSSDLATRIILTGFVFFLIFYVHLWIFVRSVENACMFKVIPINELTEGDWIADNVVIKNKIIFHKNKLSVDKKDILKFIKEGVRKVKIKEGIPFVPSFLIGTLLSFIFGIF